MALRIGLVTPPGTRNERGRRLSTRASGRCTKGTRASTDAAMAILSCRTSSDSRYAD